MREGLIIEMIPEYPPNYRSGGVCRHVRAWVPGEFVTVFPTTEVFAYLLGLDVPKSVEERIVSTFGSNDRDEILRALKACMIANALKEDSDV